jgi:membrane protein implicated in regulation of membrane protease activity
MSEPPGMPTAGPVVTPARVVVARGLITPFVALLWVGSYAKVEPDFIGIPFFYWYQMLWVPISALLTATAYVLVRRERRAPHQRKGGTSE